MTHRPHRFARKPKRSHRGKAGGRGQGGQRGRARLRATEYGDYIIGDMVSLHRRLPMLKDLRHGIETERRGF